MKFIYLLWENLVLYYRKNRLIFFLYCLCGVISTVAVLYFYGNMVPMVYNRNSTELYYREYRLISGGAPLSEDKLRALPDEEKIESVTAVCEVELKREEEGKIIISTISVAAGLQGEPPIKVMNGSASFEGASPYSVIAPFDAGFRVGDSWSFAEKEFQVIGVHGDGLYYIPAAAFTELSLTADSARVYAARKADVDDGSASALLKERFYGEAEVREPFYGRMDFLQSQKNMLLISVVYAFGILSFLLLFSYLMEETAKESAVYRVLGASREMMVLLHFWAVLLLSVLTAGLGILLHAALYAPLFSQWNLYPGTAFSSGDYLLVLFGTVVLTLAVSLPMILRVVRRTPKAALLVSDR